MRPPQLRCELFPSIYLPYIHRVNWCSYWTLTSFAALSSHVASYMVSVRQTRGLPWASFRFHITMDTLAFSYMLTATWSHSGLSPFRVRPCWANKKPLLQFFEVRVPCLDYYIISSQSESNQHFFLTMEMFCH